MWRGQKAQDLLNTFKQSDPSDLPAAIFKISWKSDPMSGSNIAVANTFTCNHILKTGLGDGALCLCQQWAHAHPDKRTRRQVGDTTALSWVGSQALWGELKPTFFLSFRGIVQDTNPAFALLERVAGEKFFRWPSHLPQRLPVRGNPGNTEVS